MRWGGGGLGVKEKIKAIREKNGCGKEREREGGRMVRRRRDVVELKCRSHLPDRNKSRGILRTACHRQVDITEFV